MVKGDLETNRAGQKGLHTSVCTQMRNVERRALQGKFYLFWDISTTLLECLQSNTCSMGNRQEDLRGLCAVLGL